MHIQLCTGHVSSKALLNTDKGKHGSKNSHKKFKRQNNQKVLLPLWPCVLTYPYSQPQTHWFSEEYRLLNVKQSPGLWSPNRRVRNIMTELLRKGERKYNLLIEQIWKAMKQSIHCQYSIHTPLISVNDWINKSD